MRYRPFGNSGLRVSELILGCMTFGHDPRWQGRFGTEPQDCRAIVDAYAESGGNVVDTANRYTEGQSETILGDILGSDRGHFLLSTKYTATTDPADPNSAGNHRKSLVRSLEQSLKRLQTDYIDIFWVHIWDPNTPIEETMRALDDAVRAGKVLYTGISDTPAWVVARGQTLAELRGWTPFCGLQVPYNLVNRQVERDFLPMAHALGLSVTAWSPLAGGVLSGKYLAEQPSNSPTRFDRSQVSERDMAVAREVAAVAACIGASPAQVALAWIRAQSPAVHPIVAARTVDQLTDNLAAVNLTLAPEVLDRLNAVSDVEPGFPADMIASTQTFVYGDVAGLVDART
jgi:aryl-alcohol dehydrogenase-like predicted oxidoreductase